MKLQIVFLMFYLFILNLNVPMYSPALVAQAPTAKTPRNPNYRKIRRIVALLSAPIIIALAPVMYQSAESFAKYIYTQWFDYQERSRYKTALELQKQLNPNAIRETKITEASRVGYLVMEDISIFDMRFWKPMPKASKKLMYSPVHFQNILRVVKTKNIDKIKVYLATSGTGIQDLHCTSYADSIRYAVTKKNNAHTLTYELNINVKQEPLNEPFTLLISGTYWDSFKDLDSNWVETYTDDDVHRLTKLKTIVKLPPQKKAVNLKYFVTEGESEEYVPYEGYGKQKLDTLSNEVTWEVLNPLPNKMYKLDWMLK